MFLNTINQYIWLIMHLINNLFSIEGVINDTFYTIIYLFSILVN